MSPNARKSGRRTLYQHGYDWLNNSDLSQLDAIMLALFVFGLGCTLITGLFVMGHLQSLALRSQANPHYRAGTIPPAPVQYQTVLTQTPYVCSPNRFGKPRCVQSHDGMWHPFAGEQSGQAEAATGYTY